MNNGNILRFFILILAISSLTLTLACNTRKKKIPQENFEIKYRHPLYHLSSDRAYFGLSPLSNKVHFISGGVSKKNGYLDSTEIVSFDIDHSVSPATLTEPAIVAGPTLPLPRGRHTSTLVPQFNKIVLMGGEKKNLGLKFVLDAVDIFNIATNSLSAGTPLAAGRIHHTANALTNGKILVLGGEDGRGNTIPETLAAELYDVSTNTTVPLTATSRTRHSTTTLSDGRVLIAGGIGSDDKALDTLEIYNPSTHSFTPLSPRLSLPRFSHSAVAVKKLGQTEVVIFVGGIGEKLTTERLVLDTIEVYDVAQNKLFLSPQKLDDPVWGPQLSVLERSGDLEIVITNGYRSLPDPSDFYLNENLVSSNENDLLIYHGIENNEPSLTHLSLSDSTLTYALDPLYNPLRFNGRGGHQSIAVLDNFVITYGGVSTECGINQEAYHCGGKDQADTMDFIERADIPTVSHLINPNDTLTKLGLAAIYLRTYGKYCLIDNKVYLNTQTKNPAQLILEYDADTVAFGLQNKALHFFLEGGNFRFNGGYRVKEHQMFLRIIPFGGSTSSGVKGYSGLRLINSSNMFDDPHQTIVFSKRIFDNNVPALAGQVRGLYRGGYYSRYSNIMFSLDDLGSSCATLTAP